jgi:ubiquitin-conjugating enzyme E2 D/E
MASSGGAAKALKRLSKELKKLTDAPVTDASDVGPVGDDLLLWRATLHGPTDTPYAGGRFVVECR